MDGKEIKILLVEDDDGHAELVKMNLDRSGLANEVIHFSNGHKVMEYLEKEKMQISNNRYVMILDINMPGMDGHQVMRIIKRDPQTSMIPIIMLTTAADEREITRCYNMGCSIYLQKPIEYEEFARATQELGLFIRNAQFPGLSVLMAA